MIYTDITETEGQKEQYQTNCSVQINAAPNAQGSRKNMISPNWSINFHLGVIEMNARIIRQIYMHVKMQFCRFIYLKPIYISCMQEENQTNGLYIS